MWDLGSLVSADPSITESDTAHASTHEAKSRRGTLKHAASAPP
jgi:hypothetical protein